MTLFRYVEVNQAAVRNVSTGRRVDPYFKAARYPPLERPLTVEEWEAAVATALRSGLPLIDGPDCGTGILQRALE